MKELKARYHSLQQIIHPDNVQQRSEKERLYSEQQSSAINDCYQTLKDPLARATYLLKKLNAFNENVALSDEFLNHMLEIQMLIEDNLSEAEINLYQKQNNGGLTQRDFTH